MAIRRPVAILHGWSDDSKSFRHLAKFLRDEHGAQVTGLQLADWVSLDDEITYRDLREAMDRAWRAAFPDQRDVYVISHSTGALVTRDWLTTKFTPADSPVSRHLMLAPANFGSQLAHTGRAWYGRVWKGLKTRFETGSHLLRGLELASPYTWELAERDLFGRQRWYGSDGPIRAAVLVGNTGLGGLASVVDEVGSDGTVRVSTANLRASKLVLDFPADGGAPKPRFESPRHLDQIAFGVCDGDNHSTIAFKRKRDGAYRPAGPRTAEWIGRALETDDWGAFVEELDASNAALYAAPEDDYFHAYQNTVVRVADHIRNPVEDFLIEFERSRAFAGWFQRNAIRKVHAYSGDSSTRSFHIDVTTLRDRLEPDQTLEVQLEAQPEFRSSKAVGYPRLPGVELDAVAVGRFFAPNRTLLVDAQVPREIGPKAFRFRRYGSK